MFLIAFRDLQFRLRRFLISVVAVALVLALTMLLAGVAASFDIEVDTMVDRFEVDNWFVATEANGPFLSAVPLPESAAATVTAIDGVEQAAPMAFFSTTIARPDGLRPVVLFGVEPGAVGAPDPDSGEALSGPGQAVVDRSLGIGIGGTLDIGGRSLDVIGRFDSATLLGGQPTAFVAMDDLQQLAYTGAPVISAVAVRGDPKDSPPGLKVQSEADARADLLRPIEPAKHTITLLTVLLWIVAGCIIGSVIYLSALERVRDFAVFKAIGVSTSWVLAGLVMQAVALSLVASVVAVAIAWLLAPAVSIPVKLPLGIILFAPATAVVVSALASLAGVRRAVKVDPALAFG